MKECIEVVQHDGAVGGHDDGVGDGDGGVQDQPGGGGEMQPWSTSRDAGAFLQTIYHREMQCIVCQTDATVCRHVTSDVTSVKLVGRTTTET